MPIYDSEMDHHKKKSSNEEPNLGSADMHEWGYALEYAIVHKEWREILLSQTGAPDLKTLGIWIEKAKENGWSASQMMEEMGKNLEE